jgi:UDP-N-acetylmuramoyl-L-alanyl-D-glutamate--2,6-diaminopimelate ligase
MKLSTLLQPFMEASVESEDVDIQGLQNDSRKVTHGDLFFAYPGALTDGRKYIEQAILAGAAAIVYEPSSEFTLPSASKKIPMRPLLSLSDKLAPLARRFYDNPSAKLQVTGVTGTNGKTTIAYQLAQAYRIVGERASYIGTLGHGEVGSFTSLMNTTPDALCLQKILADDVKLGIKQVCMEVSSHALSLHRADGIDFKQAIYTNLSRDHLDFHQTMEAYARAKALLFSTPSLETAIINQDDDYSEFMRRDLPAGCQRLTYGLSASADVRAVRWDMTMSGSTIEVASPWGHQTIALQSLGRFNIYNSLAVITSLIASGVVSIDKVPEVMSQLKASPGRMEIVAQQPCVIVDYAHSPDALENVLLTLSQLKTHRLWVVFGCGGDRDRGKRPIMGDIASQHADVVVLTDDNPRSEDPEKIIQEIMQGIPSAHAVQKIPDRRAAIHYALTHAGKADIVLIAGKGHEDYQIIGQQRYAFSDQDVVRELISCV